MNKSIKLITIIVIIMNLIGCTSYLQDVDISEVCEYILSEESMDKYSKGDSKDLKRFYGLNSNDYEDYEVYLPSSNMEVDELLIIKTKEEDQIDIVEEAIETRVNKQIESFSGYAPEQSAILEEHEIWIGGSYIFLSIGENAEELKKNLKEVIMK